MAFANDGNFNLLIYFFFHQRLAQPNGKTLARVIESDRGGNWRLFIELDISRRRPSANATTGFNVCIFVDNFFNLYFIKIAEWLASEAVGD